MALQRASSDHREITGRHVFIAVSIFFAIVIAVNLTLAWFANRSWSGLVVQNSYVASQNFNTALARARDEAALGWSASSSYRGQTLSFTIKDSGAKPVGALAGQVTLRRPASSKFDRTAKLEESVFGTYEAALALEPGQWDAELTLSATGGKEFHQVFRLNVVPP